MKSWTNKFLLGALVVVLSNGALAAGFTGSGIWKTNKGASGSYTSSGTASVQADGSKLITKTVTVGSQSVTVTFSVQKVDDTFFKIFKDGAKVGGGYCWTSPSAATKLCHWGLQNADGTKLEGTAKLQNGVAHEMGSKWDPATQVKTIWKGIATKSAFLF
jgi:hypothetical protein